MFFFILILGFLNALETYEIYNGVRPLGMGNAGLSFLEDENVNFYNPAGISTRSYNSKAQIDLINPSFAFNSNIISSFSDITSGLGTITDFIKNQNGKNYHSNLNFFPNVSIRNMSFGLLMQANIDAGNTGTYFEDDTNNPVFAVKNTYDIIPTFTIGMPLFASILKLGATAKIIWRAQFDEELPYSEMIDLSFREDLSEGFAFAIDGGAILTMPVRYLPSFSLVVRNIGNSKFYSFKNIMNPDATGVPNTILQTYDVGYGMYIIISDQLKMRYAFDYRDILDAYNNHWSKHIHTGAELSIGKSKIPFMQIRTGVNQLRWTFGLSLKSKNNTFDFAFYGEELGNSLRERGDNRYVFRYVISLY